MRRSFSPKLREGLGLGGKQPGDRAVPIKLATVSPSPNYPAGLSDDVHVLSEALDAATDQRLRIWGVSLQTGTIFIVFELLDDHRIAGVVKSADQRVVDPDRFGWMKA